MKVLNEYDQQAQEFLTATSIEFKAVFLKYGKHFDGDTEERDIYTVTLERGARSYSFKFGQSINSSMQWVANTRYAKSLSDGKRLMGESKSKMLKSIGLLFSGLNDNDFLRNKDFSEPNAYSVLACLTKYDPETFEVFCDEFGYDIDSKSAEKVYNAVREEYMNVCMLFSPDEMEKLADIQ